ncbi:hypothetical protein [Blastococcus sp. SYSU D00820]
MSATARAPRPEDRPGRTAAPARPRAARPAAVPAVSGRAHSAPLRTRPARPATRPAPGAAARPSAAAPRVVPTAPARVRAAATPAARRAPFVLLVLALLVGTTLALLFLNTAIAVDSLKATQLRAENAQKAQRIEQLEQQVVAGNTPAALASAAATAGLVPAGAAAYLVLAPDGSATLRGTPEPATAPADPAEGGG